MMWLSEREAAKGREPLTSSELAYEIFRRAVECSGLSREVEERLNQVVQLKQSGALDVASGGKDAGACDVPPRVLLIDQGPITFQSKAIELKKLPAANYAEVIVRCLTPGPTFLHDPANREKRTLLPTPVADAPGTCQQL